MLVVHIPSWFPHTGKPLDGNFIFRQIAATTPFAKAIVLHHVEEGFAMPADMAKEGIVFFPIKTAGKESKMQMAKKYVTAFQQIVEQYGKPDAIHAHVTLPLGPVAALLSRKYNVPLVISEHWSVYQPQNRHQLSTFQRLQLLFTFRQARCLTTVSDNLHQAIMETVPATKNLKFVKVSNVVDIEKFKVRASNSDIANEKNQILHISTLDNAAKNIMGVLRSIKCLLKHRNDFVLNIIHDLPNVDVEEYVRQEHLEETVRLLGRKSEIEVATAIQDCDFLLQFSNYENQPCVLLESFCCGKPVLTTPVGGIPEIANEQNATFVEPRNEEMLVERLDYMLDHHQEFEPAAISEEAQRNYSAEAVGKLFYSVYKSVSIK